MADGKFDPRTTGWRTTDDDEIALRRKRAAEETMSVVATAAISGFYGDFAVTSESSGQSYRVEVRSLSAPDNSCTCTDFRHNGLGTCKHIEATLLHLRERRKRAFAHAAAEGSPRVEVFLKRDNGTPYVCAKWPQGGVAPRVKRVIDYEH